MRRRSGGDDLPARAGDDPAALSALGDRLGHRRLYQIGQIVFTMATILASSPRACPSCSLSARRNRWARRRRSAFPRRCCAPSIRPRQLGRGLGINSVVVSSSAGAGADARRHRSRLRLLALGVRRRGAVRARLAGARPPSARARATRRISTCSARALCAATFGLIICRLEAPSTAIRRCLRSDRRRRRRRRLHLSMRPRAWRDAADPAGRPARRARCFALSTIGALDRLHRLDDADPLLALPPRARLRLHPARSRRDDRALAADHDVRRPGRRCPVGPRCRPACSAASAWRSPCRPARLRCRRPIRTISTSPGGCRCAAPASACSSRPMPASIIGSAPRERAASAGGLISTTRMTGQTLGATLVAALLAFGSAAGRRPALAGRSRVGRRPCSIARLNPALRKPTYRRKSRAPSLARRGAARIPPWRLAAHHLRAHQRDRRAAIAQEAVVERLPRAAAAASAPSSPRAACGSSACPSCS